jgi:DNA modification methylase
MALKINANKIELVPLKDIKLNPKNRNKHSPEQIAQFVKILRYQGNRNPGVISNRSGLLVAGEGRYLAMKEAGETHMPVMFQDFEDEEQEYLYGISDNAIASQAALDLAEIHVDLKDMGPFDLDLLGIKDFQFEPDPETGDADAVPDVPKAAKTKRGELWHLGDHRLLIDDCTVKENVERLMGGEKAEILFTSPPYSDLRDYGGNLTLDPSHLAKLFDIPAKTYFVNLGLIIREREIVRYWDAYLDAAKERELKLLSWNIWDKGNASAPAHQQAMFGLCHEWVFVFGEYKVLNLTNANALAGERSRSTGTVRERDGSLSKKKSDSVRDFRQLDSVIRLRALNNSSAEYTGEHPAAFPIDLALEHVSAATNTHDIVAEPFCGSGSTLIACEKTHRRCFGMEIEPLYGDVILTRYAKFAGKDPVREDGKKWSELNG